MSKKILFTIGHRGSTLETKIEGVQGGGCLDILANFEKFGEVVNSTPTEEFHQQCEHEAEAGA